MTQPRSRSTINIHPDHITEINRMAVETLSMSSKKIHDWLLDQTVPGMDKKYGHTKLAIKYEAVQQIVRKARKNSMPDTLDDKIDWIDYEKIKIFGIKDTNLSRCRAAIGALKGKMLASIPRQPVQEAFIDEEGNEVPERQTEGLLMVGKRFDFKEDYRWLKWADYVLTYAGEDIKDDLDIWIIAKVFANRDKEHYYKTVTSKTTVETKSKYFIDGNDTVGKGIPWNAAAGGVPLFDAIKTVVKTTPNKMDMLDLDDWLDYRPWVSKAKEDIYIKALEEGQATKLKFKPFPFSLPLTGVAQMYGSSKWSEPIMGFYMLATFLWNIHPDTQWDLPSKQLEKYCQEEQTLNNVHLVFKFGDIQFCWRFDPPKKDKSNIQA